MASLGHIAIGLCAGRLWCGVGPSPRRLLLAMAAFSALSLLPDADVIAFVLRVPYGAPFGHRGASHSLAFALGLGALLGVLAGRLSAFALCTAVLASHGILDALTDGGKGVALLWPFSDRRYFFPIQPLPVAPIGMRLFSPRGLWVMGRELLYFSPLFAWGLWGVVKVLSGSRDRRSPAASSGSPGGPLRSRPRSRRARGARPPRR